MTDHRTIEFADGETSHDYDWQIHPDVDVTVAVGDDAGTDADFTLTSSSGVVTGCVVGDGEVRVTDGNLQVHQSGTSARFRILMAVAATRTTLDCGDDGLVEVAGRTVDLNALGDFVPAPAVEPTPTPTPTPSQTPTPSPSVSPSPTTTQGTPSTFIPSAPYTSPGLHNVNGRMWFTTCEPYSQTTRCRTSIWATTISRGPGGFSTANGWVFNNLTYLPFMKRSQWASNPLGHTGSWTASDGRKWRTECDTAATGRNGCRSYSEVTLIRATPRAGGGYTFIQSNEWVVNNIVMFRP